MLWFWLLLHVIYLTRLSNWSPVVDMILVHCSLLRAFHVGNIWRFQVVLDCRKWQHLLVKDCRYQIPHCKIAKASYYSLPLFPQWSVDLRQVQNFRSSYFGALVIGKGISSRRRLVSEWESQCGWGYSCLFEPVVCKTCRAEGGIFESLYASQVRVFLFPGSRKQPHFFNFVATSDYKSVLEVEVAREIRSSISRFMMLELFTSPCSYLIYLAILVNVCLFEFFCFKNKQLSLFFHCCIYTFWSLSIVLYVLKMVGRTPICCSRRTSDGFSRYLHRQPASTTGRAEVEERMRTAMSVLMAKEQAVLEAWAVRRRRLDDCIYFINIKVRFGRWILIPSLSIPNQQFFVPSMALVLHIALPWLNEIDS